MDSLSTQLYAFAFTMAAGASMGFVFDLYRLLRSWLRPGAIATFIMDLFFWVIIVPMAAIYLLIANWGELRLYVLIGICLGLAFYYLLISRTVFRIAISFTHLVSLVISFFCQLVFAILVWPMKLVQDLLLTISAIRRRRRSFQFSSGWRWRGLDWRQMRWPRFGRGSLRWQAFRFLPFWRK
ncbi:MAG TPA: spore cortex biosynthesis protein YabQ [Firmicutes bacterium]|nr:spore cortex biosynthesis protein YabQ [Bacillota bacterium]